MSGYSVIAHSLSKRVNEWFIAFVTFIIIVISREELVKSSLTLFYV